MKKKRKNIKILLICMFFVLFTLPNCCAAEENENLVYLGGQSFGVKFYNDGVIVTELEDFYDGKGYVCPSKEAGLKVNDIIKTANGRRINTNEDLHKAACECKGCEIEFKVERNGQMMNKTVKPEKNSDGTFLIGAWVKDSCAGIGTVTFYDSSHNYFAALGHGICDPQTSALLPLGSAEILGATISSITKSTAGKPGSLNGYFTEQTIGSLTKNTPLGVFGTFNENDCANRPKLALAENNEVKTGKAQVYTTLDSNNVRCYDAEITQIRNKDKNCNENFVIKITDKTLLEKCGGIVQGMSGSPIVQNGKLAGAITHVFMNSPSEGYGVLAQNMASNNR